MCHRLNAQTTVVVTYSKVQGGVDKLFCFFSIKEDTNWFCTYYSDATAGPVFTENCHLESCLDCLLLCGEGGLGCCGYLYVNMTLVWCQDMCEPPLCQHGTAQQWKQDGVRGNPIHNFICVLMKQTQLLTKSIENILKGMCFTLYKLCYQIQVRTNEHYC